MDAFIDVCLNAFPPLLYILAGGGVVYFVFRFYIKKMMPIDSRTKNANCDQHASDIAATLASIKQLQSSADCKAHTRDIGETKQSLNEIKKSVRAIELALAAFNPGTVDTLSKAFSPRQLTDFGREVLTRYKADSLLRTHLESFIGAMDEKRYNTALDVEHGAYMTLLEQSDASIFNEVKTLIYNAPRYKEIDITIATICLAMSFELRNEYLKRHTDIE